MSQTPRRSAPGRRVGRPLTSRRALFGAFLALGLVAACGGPPPKAAIPKRSLDERRAVEVIIQAFRAEHDSPVPGREVPIGGGKSIKMDVGSQGHKYGVAYVTPMEAQRLGAALPPRTPAMGDALQLVRGTGKESDAQILVLRQNDYQYDDQVGTEHTETTITAENKLTRDVRDFLVRAHAEHWP